MTLPSNFPTTEPAAIPSDPFACLAPATAQATAGAPTSASFDSVFSSQSEDAAVTTTVDAAAPCVPPQQPLVSGFPIMYPGMTYMAAPAVACPTPVAKTESPVEVVESEVQDNESEQPETAKADGLPVRDEVLAYQLIAGQWVQQPAVPAQAPAPRVEPAPSTAAPVNSLCRQPEVASTVAKGFPPEASAVEKNGEKHAKIAASKTAVAKEVSPALTVEASAVAASAATKPQAPVTTASAPTPVKSEAPTPASFEVVAENTQPSLGHKPAPATASDAVSALAKNSPVTPPAVPVVESGKPVENQLPATGFRPVSDAQEKIAAPQVAGRAESVSGVNTSNESEEKKTLVVDAKKVKSASGHVGTRGANREISMSYSVANKPLSAEFTMTPSVANSAGIQTGTTAPVAQTSAPIAVQAPRLVEEIRAIADRISVIDRNSVEVRFDFSDSERLSVRVEYRDGTVHTTFRTDSSQLRDVISHEWQAQAAAADQRSYRVADPVFNSPDTKQQNSSSLEDGSGRHRAFEQPAQSATPSFAAHGRGAGSTSTAAAPSPAARTETSRHLHTFA